MILASRLAPSLRDVLPEVETLKSGLNVKARHDPIWKWRPIGTLAPSVLVAVPEKLDGSHPVGLNMNPGLSITALIARRSAGIPSMIVGNGSVVTVNCVVSGSTSILARTTCVCSVNGPTTNGTTIDNPYGAPL